MILTAVISIHTDLLAALLTLFSLSVAHARQIAEVPGLAIFMTFTSIVILFRVSVNITLACLLIAEATEAMIIYLASTAQ